MMSQETISRPLKVAVIGGGLCGITIAIGLQRAGLDVNLYEAAAKFGEIGAGVGIGPNGIRALQAMGLMDAVLEQVKPEVPVPRPFLIRSGIDHEIFYDYPVMPEDKGLGIHRAVFIDALAPLIDSLRVHFNKRCIGVKELPDSQMDISFADGTTVQADVVLGADGIRSNIRTFVVGSDTTEAYAKDNGDSSSNVADVVRVAFTGTLAYRGLVPAEKAKEQGVKLDLTQRPHCLAGDDKHIILFPIKDGKIINVVAFASDRSASLPRGTPWVTPRSSDELLDRFSDFSADARALLSCMVESSAWAIHAVHPPLDTYVRRRVALLGDAAHGMPPHLGAGAGQAIEDTRTLVQLLTHPKIGRHNVEEVLLSYDALRRPRANSVLAGSHRSGEIYEWRGPHASEGAEGMRKDLDGHWLSVWEYDLEAAIDATIADLEARGVF